MKTMVARVARQRKMELYTVAVIAVMMQILGIVVNFIILYEDGDVRKVVLGEFVVGAFCLMILFFLHVYGFVWAFNRALTFCTTRRNYVRAYSIVSLAECAGIYIICLVGCGIERVLWGLLYKEWRIHTVLLSPYILPMLVLIMAVYMCIAALTARWRKVMYVALAFFWIVYNFVQSKVIAYMPQQLQEIWKQRAGNSPFCYIAGIGCILVLAVVFYWLSFQIVKRQPVES